MTETVPRLSAGQKPLPGVGIVHLGLGAFFRAHGALYVDQAMRHAGGDWGIIGVSLMRAQQRDLLQPQGFAYTAVELGPDATTPRLVDVVQDVLVAKESPDAVLSLMANPAISIVTLTVTEKGYCHEPSTGELNLDHPDIVHDIADIAKPRSAPGFLVSALQWRYIAGVSPFTVLCCDNLPDNGSLVRRVTLALAREIDPALADWIAEQGAFPCTMVDRIVPRTKPVDIERVTQLTGKLDCSPVMHEPFSQWVIEDTFVDNARPDFTVAGVQMVDDVRLYELMKLRCLNGTHSSLAYLGYLAGHPTIYATVNDPVFAAFVKHVWQHEIVPALTPPDDEDLQQYTEALFDRYMNPAIEHLTWQIAMDGSQKLPQRILGTLADNLRADRPIDGLVLSVAAWMRYISGVDESGQPIDVRDPMAERLRTLSDSSKDVPERVDRLLSVSDIFTAELTGNERFRQQLTETFRSLVNDGARACAARIGQ